MTQAADSGLGPNWVQIEDPNGGFRYTNLAANRNPDYIPEPIPEDLVELSDAETEELGLQAQLNVLRQFRTEKLKESDWVTNNDVNLSEEKRVLWMKYRQQLRDITNNITTVNQALSVRFPEPPL
jgi:hypothetical protein